MKNIRIFSDFEPEDKVLLICAFLAAIVLVFILYSYYTHEKEYKQTLLEIKNHYEKKNSLLVQDWEWDQNDNLLEDSHIR